jgi:hypothetical protein
LPTGIKAAVALVLEVAVEARRGKFACAAVQRRVGSRIGVLLLAGMGAVLGSCGFTEDPACIPPPCPLPTAIVVSVTADGGGPVNAVSVRVSGPLTTTVPCAVDANVATCRIPGYPGTYDLEIAGEGFESAQRKVTVEGTTPPCSCTIMTTAQIDVTLRRSP